MIRINLGTEKVRIMTPKMKEARLGAKRGRPLPKEYICIAPDEAQLVFDWLNGAAGEEIKEIAKVHLRLCFHCQEAVSNLMRIDEEFRDKAGRSLHQTNSQNEHSIEASRAAAAHECNRNETDDEDHDNPSRSMKAGGRN